MDLLETYVHLVWALDDHFDLVVEMPKDGPDLDVFSPVRTSNQLAIQGDFVPFSNNS